MKRFLTKYTAAATTSTSSDAAGEEETDFSQLALALLCDHRQLQISPAPALPKQVVDPSTFPYYVSNPNDSADTQFVKQTAVDSQNAISHIRDEWIRDQMKLAEASFTTPHSVKIFIVTLNAGGKRPEQQDIDLLLQGAKEHDLIVLGLQEMVDLNVTNAVSDTASRERTMVWLEMIQRSNALQSCEYVLLASKYLVGIMLCCFVARPLKQHVNAVQTFSVSTGAMGGLVGNKGSCSIRFELFDTSFCFTSAHLAAHVEGVEARNSDVRAISQKTLFKLGGNVRQQQYTSGVPEKHHSRIASTPPSAVQRGELELGEHDYTIWLGDFNYRIDRASPEEVLDNVRDLNWLEVRDQLRREMRAKRVFAGMEEVATVLFPPTYKYEPGTDQYERRAEKKLRAPAWTDRIVWKHLYEASCLLYQSNAQVKFSDHRAVECGLKTQVRRVRDDARDEVYRAVLNKLEFPSVLPSSTTQQQRGFYLSNRAVDFGKVVYRQVLAEQIELRNDEAIPVVWRLVQRPDAPNWFVANRAFGLLLPGESCRVEFQCELGLETVRGALGQTQFRDVVEIRIHPANAAPGAGHGASAVVATLHTFFIGVRAELLPSCFGATSIAALLWAIQPIQQYGPGEFQFSTASSSANAAAPLAVPKELWRLAFRLQRELHVYRIFLTHGDADECRLIRACLDTGAPFPTSGISIYAYANVFLELLDALAEPVVPVDLFPEETAMQDAFWQGNWFAALPTPNVNTLQLVLSVVSKTLALSSKNKVTLQAIAPLFAEVLFRPSVAATLSRETATMNASGFGEFASWLGSSSNSAGKVESTKSQAALTAFCSFMTSNA